MKITRATEWAILAAAKRLGPGPRLYSRAELVEFAHRNLNKRPYAWFARLKFKRRNFSVRSANLAFNTWIREIGTNADDRSRTDVFWCRIANVTAPPPGAAFLAFVGGIAVRSKFDGMAAWSGIVDCEADIEYAICYGKSSDYILNNCAWNSSFEVSEENPSDE